MNGSSAVQSAGAGGPRPAGRIVVWGLLAHTPFGGMVWQVLHYLVGLRRLGFDVWYVEDADQMMLDLAAKDWVVSAKRNAAFVDRYLGAVGMGERWVVRTPGSRECFGARDWHGLLRLYSEADLVINLCGSHELCTHHDGIRDLLYLETDPVQNQVDLALGLERRIEELRRYATLATYATNIYGDDCLIPASGRQWLVTVPPVVLSSWDTGSPPRSRTLTTVMNWSSPARSITWQDQRWSWSKRSALQRLSGLPARTSAPLAIAMRETGRKVRDRLYVAGWTVSDAAELDRPGAYRRFIRSSYGEMSVAKEQYVAPRSGWISDRTVCYLAAGRPAVVERTGIAGVPLGAGLLDFATMDEAVLAIDAITSGYERHAVAARGLAAEYFSAEKVLRDLLERAGLW